MDELKAKLQELIYYHAQVGKPGGPDFIDFYRKFGELLTADETKPLIEKKADNAKPDSDRRGK